MTKLKHGKDARELLKQGVDTVANTVKVSLGAAGRNVVVPDDRGGYFITKDGVTIARSIYPEDTFEAIGASLIKEAAARTNQQAGDGTTTATVLAQSIYEAGLNYLEKGNSLSSVDMKRGIDDASKYVVDKLKELSRDVTLGGLKDVATISANGDSELGGYIAEAFEKIGMHGQVLSKISDTKETYIEVNQGTSLEQGYTSRVFTTDKVRDICKMEDGVHVLLHRGKLQKGDDIHQLLKKFFEKPDTKLLIITDDIDNFVHDNLATNAANGAINDRICIVTIPQVIKINVDLMSDLAAITGASITNQSRGDRVSFKALGRIQSCVVSQDSTILVADGGVDIEPLKEHILEKINSTSNEFEKKELQERFARVTGGIATLYVGASSDSELREKQDRVEDAINATRSALEEGIVSGGGVVLRDISNGFDKKLSGSSSYLAGWDIVMQALHSPYEQILENAGLNVPVSPELGMGIDVKTGKKIMMIEKGIIDPAKVTRCAIENASSVAGTFLTTEGVVAS